MTPILPHPDRIRLAEAFRLGEALCDNIWPGWSQTPFAVLLITPDDEFLIRHPHPSPDFTPLGHDALLKSDVHYRKRTLPTHFLATFPAVGGLSTVVIGQAENTSVKTSTPWVLTALHEHFHQLQEAQPHYYTDAAALNLSHGDQTGMWMLNYPFPYHDAHIAADFAALARRLATALDHRTNADFPAQLTSYLEARTDFQHSLAPDDYRYLSFQLWLEGVARYTEWRIGDLAARHYDPTPAFRALPDYTPFSTVADTLLHDSILSRLSDLSLAKSERTAVYPFGAAEALLLDRANPHWPQRYFTEKFVLERYYPEK